MQLRVLVACECSGRVREAFAKRGWQAWSADILPSELPPRLLATRDISRIIVNKSAPMNAGGHYQGDVLDLFNWNHPVNDGRSNLNRSWPLWDTRPAPPLWDLIIAHPPCTDLSYAGARWFKLKDARRGGDGRMQAAAAFFMEMLAAPSPLVAVENPHSIVQEKGWAGPSTQVVQPWWFGDPYVKDTHLWLKGLPELNPDKPVTPEWRVTTGGGSWRTDKAAQRKAMSAYEDSEGRINRAKVRSRTFPGFARAMADQWGSFAEKYYADTGRH